MLYERAEAWFYFWQNVSVPFQGLGNSFQEMFSDGISENCYLAALNFAKESRSVKENKKAYNCLCFVMQVD